jgi:beta-lactamase regulating signal transducer with metallopeptidase domain
MLNNFSFLDYVWRGLLVGTLLSTIVLSGMFFVFWLLRERFSQTQMKWFFNYQILLLFLAFLGSFLFVAVSDPELAVGCFNQFVKDSSSFTITRIIAGVWLLAILSILWLDSIKIYFSFKKSKKHQPVIDDKIESVFKKCLIKSKCIKNPQLFKTKENVSPYAWGLFRHRVVVPESSLNLLNADTWESIFAHELIHIKDHDSLWLLLELLCRRLLFFNPLIYLAHKKHLLAIEKAADEQALNSGGMDLGQFIKSLIEVVELCKSTDGNPLAVSASRSFLEIKERIESLSQAHRPVASQSIYYSVLFASFLLTTGFSVAQAKSAINGFGEKASIGMMCSQLRHEKIIESWLHIEPVPNRCEQ